MGLLSALRNGLTKLLSKTSSHRSLLRSSLSQIDTLYFKGFLYSGIPSSLDQVDVAFYGDYKELDEKDKETVRDMVRIMRERRAVKQEN